MKTVFEKAGSALTHYYLVFSNGYETTLKTQVAQYKELWKKIHVTLPNHLNHACTKLFSALDENARPEARYELTETQCKSYYEIVIKPLEQFLHTNPDGPSRRMQITHTAASKIIHETPRCKELCHEFIASNHDFSGIIIDCQETQELVNQAIYIRSVALGALAAGFGYAACLAYKNNRKSQAVLLGIAAAVTGCTAVFFVHSNRKEVSFR